MSAKTGHEIERTAWLAFCASTAGVDLDEACAVMDYPDKDGLKAVFHAAFQAGIAAGKQSARLDLKGRILYALMGES